MTYDLNELQALLAKMTPGNWSAKELAKTLEAGIRSRPELAKFHDTTDYQADAAGIVALVNAARGGLIADHQALQARVADLEKALDDCDRARVMIGARLDSMSEAQKECAINEAWHVLQRAIVKADVRAALGDQP